MPQPPQGNSASCGRMLAHSVQPAGPFDLGGLGAVTALGARHALEVLAGVGVVRFTRERLAEALLGAVERAQVQVGDAEHVWRARPGRAWRAAGGCGPNGAPGAVLLR